MPGERLMCIWQAAYATDPAATGNPKKTILQYLSQKFDQSPLINFDPVVFDSTFKEDTIDYVSYKTYMLSSLKAPGASTEDLIEYLEDTCWEVCKPHYSLEASTLQEDKVFKLWQVFNKLVFDPSMPLKLQQAEAEWLTEKILALFGRQVYSKQMSTLNGGITFAEYLTYLDEYHLKNLFKEQVDAAIKDVYQELVEEVRLTGWLHKRTKRHSNWTGWTHRYFILTPGLLEYYTDETLKDQKGEATLQATTQISSNGGQRRELMKKYVTFKISNAPFYELELSPSQEKDRVKWVAALQDIVEACKAGTTPVQNVIQQRYQKYLLSLQCKSIEDAVESKTTPEYINIEEMNKENMKPLAKLPAKEPVQAVVARAGAKIPSPKTGRGKMRTSPKNSVESLNSSDDEDVRSRENFLFDQQDKMKLVFGSIDRDGNGKIGRNEFATFIDELGVTMATDEVNMLFDTIDKDGNNSLCLDEFSEYFLDVLAEDRGASTQIEATLRTAFLKADQDGTGKLDFKEFVEYAWERKRNVRISQLVHAFEELDADDDGQVSFHEFRDYMLQGRHSLDSILEEDEGGEGSSSQCTLERRLRSMYNRADTNQMVDYLRNRWKAFVSFRRPGASGELAMKGESGIVADIVPGKYSLLDLACFEDLPPLEPKHAVVKGVRWQKSTIPGKSGKVIFPDDFDFKIPVDIATNEHLRYYGASLADQNGEQVALLYRHAIQDFTYQNQYLSDYVTNPAALGGAGIEKHEFTHLDCPMQDDSGIFILAKFTDEAESELHITGFHVPTRHTLYIPGNVIHSNDYLKGTWRTMLSDEAVIDHVQLMQRVNGHCTHNTFTFV